MRERVGKQFGNYRLIRFLGEGGFAEVYLGEHIYLKTTAAIKILRANLQGKDLQAFHNEARTIANLRHPHIVRVLEFGLEAASIPFLVMTYAPHGTLRQHHPKKSVIPLEDVIAYVKQVASALQYAHENKLIHRDVKPENMLLGRNDEVLLSDFGIAVTAHSSISESRQKIVGTPLYMAPEQLQGRPRPASDQYALGIVVYEWLSGSPPFTDSGFLALAAAHLHTPPRPLCEQVPTLSTDIAKIVMKAIAKDPSERFPTVQAFTDALEDASKAHASLSVFSSLTTSPLPLSPDLSLGVAPSGQVAAAVMNPFPGVVSEEVVRQRHRPSRRVVVMALASVTGLSSIGGGIAWYLLGRAQDTAAKGRATGATTPSTSPTPVSPSPTELPSYPVGTTILTYSKHTDSVTGLTWSPDGSRIASSSNDQTVHVWSVSGNAQVQTLVYSGHTDSVLAVAWSPNSQYLASGSKDKTVHVWIAPAVQPLLPGKSGDTILVYQGSSAAVAWSPDNQRIASATRYMLETWDAITGKHALYSPDLVQNDPFPSTSGPVTAVVWSPNGRYIASSPMSVSTWDATSGNRLLNGGYQTVVHGLAWSPDGKYIASAGEDKTVLVWDSTQGTTLFTYTEHRDAVHAVAWSPDGKYLASASRDTTVQVWYATTGQTVYTYQGHNAAVNAVIWSADSKHLASGGDDKTVQIWQGR